MICVWSKYHTQNREIWSSELGYTFPQCAVTGTGLPPTANAFHIGDDAEAFILGSVASGVARGFYVDSTGSGGPAHPKLFTTGCVARTSTVGEFYLVA